MMAPIVAIQELLGVKPDGVWGPKSQAALIAADSETKKAIQALLGVKVDGEWGPKSQAALNAIRDQGFRLTKFSSFADPADVAAFLRCKLPDKNGRVKSDVQCFAVGDNGIGQFGKITAQDKVPMVAIHGDECKARWGSIQAAAHRPVILRYEGKEVMATNEDRISARGKVDLNPAAAKALGLRPPFVVVGEWRWA